MCNFISTKKFCFCLYPSMDFSFTCYVVEIIIFNIIISQGYYHVPLRARIAEYNHLTILKGRGNVLDLSINKKHSVRKG